MKTRSESSKRPPVPTSDTDADAQHALIRSRIEAARNAWRARGPRPQIEKRFAWVQAELDGGASKRITLRSEQNGWQAPGLPLVQKGDNRWEVELELVTPAEFKLTLDDEIWEEGPNRRVAPGETVVYTPRFPVAAA